MAVEIRRVDPDRDAELLLEVDTSFETATVFDVHRQADGFTLVERSVDPPVTKAFPLEDRNDRRWDSAWLALSGARPVGFVATQLEAWNGRVIVWHLYVSHDQRGQGIGRRLLETALAAAQEQGASRAWLETSNLNVPGVRAYRRMGFELVGLDVSLYDNTAAEGETALFLARSLPR